MNFLSHYHFYRTEDPYYNVGLVLPDLVRNICNTHLRPHTLYIDPIHESLGKGSRSHIEGDRIFHQSEFFKTCENHISSLLDAKAQWPRKWFLNHLLLEIALDRTLMDTFPDLCTDFYDQLEQIESEHITSFLKISETDHFTKFGLGYERFVNFKFIFDYMHNEKIIFALSRVYLRTGIEYEWKREDEKLLLQQLPEILSFINKHTGLLQQELKLK